MKERTKLKRMWEYNPQTHTPEASYKEEVVGYTMDDSDRNQVVLDILRGTMTPEDAKSRFMLASVNSIYTWIGKYVSQSESLSLQPQTSDEMANKSKDNQIRELKAALKQAQKKAELEELRAKAYDKMITLAEESFNIPIRKKSGTKQ